MNLKTPSVKTQYASDLIHIDTYIANHHLVVSKAKQDKTYIGRAYAMSPLLGGGGEFSDVVLNLFKSVPDDSLIQFNLICEPDHDAADNFARGKIHGSVMVRQLIDQQCDLLRDATEVGWQPDVPLLNRRTLLMSLAIPIRQVDAETIEDATVLQEDFLSNIRNCGFYDVRALSASELLGYYAQFVDVFKPATPVVLDELIELKHQVFGPDQTIAFTDPKVGVFNGDTYCAVVAVKAFPEIGFHGLMNLVTGAPFNKGPTKEGGGQRILTPFIYNTTIRVGQQRKEMERVQRAIKSRSATKTLPFKLGNEDPTAKLDDLQYIEKQCANDGEKFVYVSSTAFVFAKTRAQALETSAVLTSTLNKLYFDARQVRHDGVVRWAQSLPLNFAPGIANKLACEAIMPLSAAGCLAPVYGDNRGNAKLNSENTGAAFITRRGTPHLFDPFHSNSNYNGTFVATMGGGKSFVLQYLINCALAEGTNVFLLDNGRSTKKYCNAVGGEFNEFSLSEGYRPSLNPFTGLSDEEFNQEQESITELLLLMAFHNEPVQPGARIAMSEAVRAAHGCNGADTEIRDVVDALIQTSDQGMDKTERNEVEMAATNLIPRLEAFLRSPSRGTFFNGLGTINTNSQFTVFEMGGLNGDLHLYKCVMFFVLNMLMTRIKNIKGRKLIFVDEAHDVFQDAEAAKALQGIYLKGRKDAVGVFVIVQSLIKLATSSAGKVILNTSQWKLILSQKDEEIDDLFAQSLLTKHAQDAYFKNLIKSIETQKGVFSEILIECEQYYEAVRLYVDKFTSTLFSSEGDARDEVFDLMAAGMSAVDAVHHIMGNKKKGRIDFLRLALQHVFDDDDKLTAAEVINDVQEVLQ